MSPAPFEAHLDQKKARSQAIFGGVGAIGSLIFLFNARKTAWAMDQGFEAMVPAIIGLGIFFLFAGLMFRAVKTLRSPNQDAVLRMNESGVFDTRITSKVIPWSAINNAEIVNLRDTTRTRVQHNEDRNVQPVHAVSVSVKNASDYLKGEGALGATSKALSEATGYEGIILNPAELNTTAQAILDAILAHRN